MFLSVDRIEENKAVCIDDDGKISLIETKLIEGEIKEGSIIKMCDGGFFVDKDEEDARRKENFALAESLFDE